MKAVVIYWSKSGNTKKTALAINDGLQVSGVNTLLIETEEADKIDFFDYDLVCIGMPSYQWQPPEPVNMFLKTKFNEYRKKKLVKVSAPVVRGKYALVFCTYSGPHTGIKEAVPVGKYTAQFFEHLGFTVLDEWYVLSEFHGSEEMSTKGRMGDIRGLPSAADLAKITKDTTGLVSKILEKNNEM